ncbi:MAG: ABC transporter permease [Chloroflexi bacterium]|nr:ABC transporter permease [Chloroflexota bacterium]
MPDTVTDEATLLPRIVVEVGLGENARQVEVIAILERISGAFVDLDGEDGGLPTLLLPEPVASQVIGQSESTRHYISTRDGADTLDVAQGIERELRIFAVDIQGELQRQQSTQSSILALFQGFIGIGLVAGLAALGVIALRAVVERRQQIGVLRAIGFQSRLVGFELLIEMGFIALLGLGLGTGLALGLAWRLFAEGTFGEISMHVPVGTILPILIGAFLASLVLTYFPARQAARTTIAEALRYE